MTRFARARLSPDVPHDIRGNANCFFTPVGLAARSRHNFPGRGPLCGGQLPRMAGGGNALAWQTATLRCHAVVTCACTGQGGGGVAS